MWNGARYGGISAANVSPMYVCILFLFSCIYHNSLLYNSVHLVNIECDSGN